MIPRMLRDWEEFTKLGTHQWNYAMSIFWPARLLTMRQCSEFYRVNANASFICLFYYSPPGPWVLIHYLIYLYSITV